MLLNSKPERCDFSRFASIIYLGVLYFLLYSPDLANGEGEKGGGSGNDGFRLKSRLIESAKGRDELSIDLAASIYESICWFEYLKLYLPKTHSLDFNQCHGQANFQRNVVLKHGADERFFGQFLLEHGMKKIPSEYITCAPYLLRDRHSSPRMDYSHIFTNRSNEGFRDGFFQEIVRLEQPHPYKAFVHCMIQVAHQKYGEEGLQILKERLTTGVDWKNTMLQRENEFRLLHRVQPLVINDELTFRAQKWAIQLARDCQMYHIHSSHPDYHLNGTRMGENLFTGDGIHSRKDDMALFGTNIWYEEIKDYPWPEYKGFGSDPFLKFSHFSQMIWKETEMVGYGYAINQTCGQYFIVSRYTPPGNFYGRFAENILPLSR